MSIVLLTEEVEKNIREEGEKSFPFECCGFLFGNENSGREIHFAKPVLNSKEGDQRRRFEISPLEYMRAEKFALENNWDLLGVYHSHPNHPAIASEHDLKVAMPYFSYVIVSVLEGKSKEILSWKLKDDKREFIQEKIGTKY